MFLRWFLLVVVFETRFCSVILAGLELLGSCDSLSKPPK